MGKPSEPVNRVNLFVFQPAQTSEIWKSSNMVVELATKQNRLLFNLFTTTGLVSEIHHGVRS